MITCFSNLVGIKGVTGFDSPTYDYVNSIAGITTDQLDQIRDTTGDDYDISDAWETIYNRAIKSFYTDVQSKLKRYFKKYSMIDNVVNAYYRGNVSAPKGSPFLNGWFFDFLLESKNLAVNINSATVFKKTADDFVLYFYDLNTGQLLDQITCTGAANLQHTYNLNKSFLTYKTSRLFVAYNETELSTIVADDLELKHSGIVRRARIASGGSIVYQNISQGDAATGLILNFNIVCSLDNVICSRLALFQEAFKYRVGVSFCDERIYSDRINRYTLMDREQAIELRAELIALYKKELIGALDGMKMRENDYCFECSREINYRTQLP
jgi:hypothetical protein